MKLQEAVSLNSEKMGESCYKKLRKDMHEQILHISTKCNSILVLIGEDWSLSHLEYQVTFVSQT
jgi:hypothetical protein